MPSGGELGDLKREIEVLREEIASLRSKEDLRNSDGGQQFSTTQSDRTATAGTDDRATQSWRESGFLFARKHRYILPIVAVVIVAIVVGGYFLWGYLHSYESTGDAKIAGTITPISSEVAGKISKVLVRNGQHVTAGELLLEIDAHPYKLAVATAEAKYDAARGEAEIAARKHQDLTKSQPSGLSRLGDGKQKLQDAQFEARELLDIRLAAQHGAEAALKEARLEVQYTKVTAPAAGVIDQAAVSVGQVVGQSQRLMALVQTGDLWVQANFKETQLRRLHPGQPATINVDALGSDFAGYVESIAPATNSEFTLLPAENASGNFVKVVQRIRVRIDFKTGQDRSRLRPGMSVEPTVWVKHE